MSVSTLIQLALAVMQLANWIARKVDQATWEKSGYQKAMLEQIAQVNASVASAKAVAETAKKQTDKELDRILTDE